MAAAERLPEGPRQRAPDGPGLAGDARRLTRSGPLAPPGIHRVLDLAQLVEHVRKREPRMAEHHARPGVAHDLLGLLALRPLVAVDRALGTGRLALAVGALLQPLLRIVEE